MKTRRPQSLFPQLYHHAAASDNQDELQGEDSMPAEEETRVFTADETQDDTRGGTPL